MEIIQDFIEIINSLKEENIFAKDFKWDLKIQGKNPSYIYLTLIEDEPVGTKDRWEKVSYSRFHDVLIKYLKNKDSKSLKNICAKLFRIRIISFKRFI